MRSFDFSSWQAIGTTLAGLVVITLIGVGIRLIAMLTIQQRRERGNRQINERLKTLIAAYKVLGGSFTGALHVDPTHLRDLRRAPPASETQPEQGGGAGDGTEGSHFERARRIRDSVEAALSDIILLGTEEQVRLAAAAAAELAAGKPVHTHDLVVSLRNFVRETLDLAAIPADVVLPRQGPTRPSPQGGRGKGEDRGGEARAGRGGGGAGAGMGGAGMGGAGLGLGLGLGAKHDRDHES